MNSKGWRKTQLSLCVWTSVQVYSLISIDLHHQPYPHPVPVYHIQGMAVTKGFSHLGEESTGFHLRKATSVADGIRMDGWAFHCYPAVPASSFQPLAKKRRKGKKMKKVIRALEV
jgi:hypothetical protein